MKHNPQTPKLKRLKVSQLLMLVFAPLLKRFFASTPTHYYVVGRNSAIDLKKYQTQVHGRTVIDYAKLERDQPELYRQILEREQASDRAASDRT